MTGRWLLLDFVLVVAAFVFATKAMGYPWQLALLTAMAVGALAYSARRTYWNLRLLHRPPSERFADAEPDQDDSSGEGLSAG